MTDNSWQKAADAANSFSGDLLGIALVVVAIGTISMALVDVIKGVFRLRYLFHKYYLKRWLKPCVNPKAGNQLMELVAGERCFQSFPRSFGELTTREIFARVRGAAHSALDFPQTYSELYYFLTSNISGAQEWLSGASSYRNSDHLPCDTGQNDLGDFRIRMGSIVERRLDVVEGEAQWWWNRCNQAAAILFCTIIFTVVFTKHAGWQIGPAFLLSLSGGILAPFAKDLVSQLSQAEIRRRIGR